MVQKITQHNRIRATRAAHAVSGVVQILRLGTASAHFYLTSSMPTQIRRFGRFAPGADKR